MTDPKEIVCMISTTILAVLGIVQSYHGIKNRVKNLVSWRAVEKGTANLLTQMRKDQYFPDAIIAMGRGG
ncbi:MAG: hypothetical protein ACYS3S_20050, partial [Planctomycetota bacterium]